MPDRDRHPAITPLRALAFLRQLEAAGNHPSEYLLRELRSALAEHVAGAIVRRRKRARRRST
jgi:hypothetical protein